MPEAVIGLEIHVELETRTKMFCGCANVFGAPPNTHVCPVCMALPGALPLPNAEAVRGAISLALALGAEVAPELTFDRKNYFYPDLPKGYQISQSRQPLALGGRVKVGEREVRIHHLHLEEDAGKLLHLGGRAGVDFNRAGVPLVEIVSEPDLHSAEEARAYMEEVRRIVQHVGISEVRMEEGRMRADVNVSVRGSERSFGARAEIKNMNSFRAVERAVRYEIQRQMAEVAAGGGVRQETRGFNDETGETYLQRLKEEADDYRYFPEPDLPPVALTDEVIGEIRASLPPLPDERRRAFAGMGIACDDIALLLDERSRGDLLAAAVEAGGEARAMANWILGDVIRIERESATALASSGLTAGRLVALQALLEKGEISGPAAKKVLEMVYRTGEEPQEIVRREGLATLAEDELGQEIAAVFDANPKAVADLAGGNEKTLFFLVGQLVRRTGGRADPKRAAAMIRERAQAWKPPS